MALSGKRVLGMREILLFSAAVCLAAVFAPQFLSELAMHKSSTKVERVAARVEKPKSEARKEKSRSVTHAARAEIRAGSNGHFLLDADVNLNPIRFVVDTGASFVALRESDARAMIEQLIAVVEDNWGRVCDEAGLATIERDRLWGRALLNPYCLQGWEFA